MTPERWRRAAEVFHAALEQPPEQIQEFVRANCSGDDELEQCVRTMIDAYSAGGPLDRPLAPFTTDPVPVFAPDEHVAGRYRILRFVGRGGMGEVYEAEDLELRERVALKTLPRGMVADEAMTGRFKREIQLARKIAHSNVCRVYDLGRHGEILFLTMEFLDGETLGKALAREGSFQAERALAILEQIASGLDAAHQAGIIHRDLKPSNVMLVGSRVVVTDFGLARSFHPSGERTESLSRDLVGTPDYMAPELLTGRPPTVSSDVYALAMVAYEVVTGDVPFANEAAFVRALLRAKASVPSPRNIAPALTPAWERTILRGLDPDSTKRFAGAGEFVKALRGDKQSLTLPLPKITRRWAAAWAVVLLILAGLAAGWLWNRRVTPPRVEALEWYQTGSVALRDATYYRAVRALEQAVAKDPKFALAHARLAEAANEIDDSERAKSEILLATDAGANHRISAGLDDAFIDAIKRTLLGDFPGAIQIYLHLAGSLRGAEKAQVLVDLGRARERNDEIPKALEAYREAAGLDPQNAAAHLRAAILLGGRQMKFGDAAAEFDHAASIYESLSNTEGLAEVEFQRGLQASTQLRLPEARATLAKAIQLSRTISTRHQEIASTLQLSIVTYLEGDPVKAEEIASGAIEKARQAGMEGLAARGLTDLGIAKRGKGDPQGSEASFQQAMELSRHFRLPQHEARGLLSLADLHQSQGATELALKEAMQALTFYRHAGFRQLEALGLTVMARIHRDAGAEKNALEEFQQQLGLAQAVGDSQQIALAEQGMGSVLYQLERWPEALQHYERFYLTAKSTGNSTDMARALCDQANMLWRMGRPEDADRLFMQCEMQAGPSALAALAPLIASRRAEMALSRDRFGEAVRQARRAIENASAAAPDRATAKCVSGLALARSGSLSRAKDLSGECYEELSGLGERFGIAEAKLARSEVLLLAKEAQAAQETAAQAAAVFDAAGHKESAWRAWALAARAYAATGQRNEADEAAKKSAARFAELRTSLGEACFRDYLRRPDIQRSNQFRERLSHDGLVTRL